MKVLAIAMAFAMVALGGCDREAAQAPANAQSDSATNESTERGANAQSPVAPPRAGPDAKTQLTEPKGPIDPTSGEAAGQVVQHYGALVEQGRFAEAAELWSSSTAAAEFARQLGSPEVHLSIGELGPTEGAAGSIYMTVPVTFYRGSETRPANIILRRVNNVPGSTERQRRWHIERIEWTRR